MRAEYPNQLDYSGFACAARGDSQTYQVRLCAPAQFPGLLYGARSDSLRSGSVRFEFAQSTWTIVSNQMATNDEKYD